MPFSKRPFFCLGTVLIIFYLWARKNFNEDMIKNLLKLGALLVMGILIYNYFLGTPDEKATSKRIFGEMKDVGAATLDLLKSEKQKFNEGKYDEALDKVKSLFSNMREKADGLSDSDLANRVKDLELKREKIQSRIKEAEKAGNALSEEEKQDLKKAFDEMMEETAKEMNDLEKK